MATTPIVALDLPSADTALALVDRIGDRVDFYKVGLALYTRTGPDIVRALRSRGKRVFLDLKFHDIPNTVAGAVASAAELGVDLLTLHAGGGTAMMAAARTAAGERGPRLLAVTVLTSHSADSLRETWDRPIPSVEEQVLRLAGLAHAAHMDGVVASPLEAAPIRRRLGPSFLVVTPGIRPAGAALGDQSRVATPAAAARAGADYIVIGRPVLEAADPCAVLDAVSAELGAALEAV